MHMRFIQIENATWVTMRLVAWQEARNIEKKAKLNGVDFLLPSDQVVAANLEGPLPTAIVPLTLACCTSPLEVCRGHMHTLGKSQAGLCIPMEI